MGLLEGWLFGWIRICWFVALKKQLLLVKSEFTTCWCVFCLVPNCCLSIPEFCQIQTKIASEIQVFFWFIPWHPDLCCLNYLKFTSFAGITGLNIYRKAPYFMGKSLVSSLDFPLNQSIDGKIRIFALPRILPAAAASSGTVRGWMPRSCRGGVQSAGIWNMMARWWVYNGIICICL